MPRVLAGGLLHLPFFALDLFFPKSFEQGPFFRFRFFDLGFWFFFRRRFL